MVNMILMLLCRVALIIVYIIISYSPLNQMAKSVMYIFNSIVLIDVVKQQTICIRLIENQKALDAFVKISREQWADDLAGIKHSYELDIEEDANKEE